MILETSEVGVNYKNDTKIHLVIYRGITHCKV